MLINPYRFGGGSPTPGLLDSVSESGITIGVATGSSKAQDAVGVVTVLGASKTITSAKFYLKKQGDPTGSIYFKLWNVTGFPGATAYPTGSVLGTSAALNIYAHVSASEFNLHELAFSTPVEVSSEVALTCHYEGGDVGNYLLIGNREYTAGEYAERNRCQHPFTSWTYLAYQGPGFYLYGY